MQEKEIDGKAIWSYGNPEAEKVLIQLVGEHEISGIEQEFHSRQNFRRILYDCLEGE